MTTIDLAVPTVHCTACKLNIEEELEELDGVESSAVDLEAKQVTVTYDPEIVEVGAIVAAVGAVGYPVTESRRPPETSAAPVSSSGSWSDGRPQT